MRPNLNLKELRNHIVCVHHKNRGKHKQHFGLFFESKSKRRLVQTNVHFKFFDLSESKRLTNLPAAAKHFSSSVYVIDATCFDECFLFHVITGRRYFF